MEPLNSISAISAIAIMQVSSMRDSCKYVAMDSQEEQDLIAYREWLQEVLDAHPDLKPTPWAKLANVAATTITRHIYPKEGVVLHVPKPTTLRKLAGAVNLPTPQFNSSSGARKSEPSANAFNNKDSINFSQNPEKYTSPTRGLSRTVPVTRYIQAGALHKMGSNQKPFDEVSFYNPTLSNKTLFGMRIMLGSGGQEYPEGATVIVAEISESAIEVDDVLILERPEGNSVETVLAVCQGASGVDILCGVFNEHGEQNALALPADGSPSSDGWSIFGVVVGESRTRARSGIVLRAN